MYNLQLVVRNHLVDDLDRTTIGELVVAREGNSLTFVEATDDLVAGSEVSFKTTAEFDGAVADGLAILRQDIDVTLA